MKMQETSTRKYVDASPGPAKILFQHDDAAGNLGKICEMMRTPQGRDAGRSPARTRCTDAGKVVRRKDCNFMFKNSTVANLRYFVEPSLITRGLTEGPSQLFSATGPKVYTPEQDLEDSASQLGARKQI